MAGAAAYAILQPMKLFAYYNREIIHLMLGIMATLLVIMISVSFIKYLAMAADGEMPLKNAIAMLGIILPYFISILIPISLFLSIVIGMGRLLGDNELTIGFASGMGWFGLLRRFTKPLLYAVGVTTILSFFVVPKMTQYQQNLTQIASQNSSILSFVQSGRFFAQRQQGVVVYVGKIDFKTRQSRDIFIYQKTGDSTYIVLAPYGVVTQQGDQLANLNLQKGREYDGVLGSLAYRMVGFQSLNMTLIPSYDFSHQDLSAQSSLDLWRLHNHAAATELEWRAALPLACIVLTVLGFALGDLKQRKGRYTKVFYAIGIFIIYFNLESIQKSLLLAHKMSLFPGLFLIHAVFLCVGLLLLCIHEGYFNFVYRVRIK